jgi:predicted nucleic acid-binding protein
MTKTLHDIPDQATVMVDTNIVVYALFPQGRYHQMCKALLQRSARGEVQLRLTVSAAC